MSVEQEILVTGIKVVDLLAPYVKGGKIGKLVICKFTIKCKAKFEVIFFSQVFSVVLESAKPY